MTSTQAPIARSPLGNPAFRRAWAAGALAQTMRWLEMLVVSVFVFRLTESPLQVAAVLFLRMLPSFMFGAVTGALAERFDRKQLVTTTLAVLAGVSTVLGVLVLLDLVAVWHIAVGVFVNGTFWSMDHSVRRTLLGDLAGPHAVGQAIALDSSTANVTRAVGPLLGGVLLETLGMAGAYFLGTVLFGMASLLLASVAYNRPATVARGSSLLTNIREGFAYVRSSRIILGTLFVTLFMNFWGFAYQGMVPIIGKQDLGLGPLQVGILMSMEGLGAFAAALVIAWRLQYRNYTRAYYWGSVLFLTCVIVFAQSETFPAALAVLLVAGLGFAGFGAMQSTIILAVAHPDFRARAMGVVSVCIGGGGPLGILHVGFLADWFGATTAVTITAVEGLAGLALAAWLWPELLRPLPPRT